MNELFPGDWCPDNHYISVEIHKSEEDAIASTQRIVDYKFCGRSSSCCDLEVSKIILEDTLKKVRSVWINNNAFVCEEEDLDPKDEVDYFQIINLQFGKKFKLNSYCPHISRESFMEMMKIELIVQIKKINLLHNIFFFSSSLS